MSSSSSQSATAQPEKAVVNLCPHPDMESDLLLIINSELPLQAHKAILSIASPVLREALKNDAECKELRLDIVPLKSEEEILRDEATNANSVAEPAEKKARASMDKIFREAVIFFFRSVWFDLKFRHV